MFFWYANSAVALLFLILIVAGIRQRLVIFAAINLLGMLVEVVVVYLDILGKLDMAALFAFLPALFCALAADAVIILRELRNAGKLSFSLNGRYLFKHEARQDYLIISDEKRLQAELDREAKLSPENRAGALENWRKGNEAFLRRDYKEAENRYNLSVASAPTPSALSNLAGVLIEMQRAEEAVQHCRRACNLDADHHEAWINQGAALFLCGRSEKALFCFEKATALQPNTLEPWIYRGNALRKLGKSRQALECYDTALQINPARPESWYEKALTFTRLDELQEALRCLDSALNYDPDHVYAWLNRGLLMERLGHFDQAITCYRRFLHLAPPEMKKQTATVRARLHQLVDKDNRRETAVNMDQLELAI